MPKYLLTLLILYPLVFSGTVRAEWRLETSSWLSDDYFTLFRAGEANNTGLFLTTNNMDSYQFHLLLSAKTLDKNQNEFPFIVKGEVFFDNQKHGLYTLKNAVNVNRYKGADYQFGEDFLDAEVYEKLKHSKQFAFRYQGRQGKTYQIVVDLSGYYSQFNRFTTQRMYEIVPSFLDYQGKQRYRELVGRCIVIAEGQVDDIKARNNNIDKNTRIKQVITHYKQLKRNARNSDSSVSRLSEFDFSEQALSDRVSRAYEFYGDTQVPEWLLYPFFSQCYNKAIDNFSA
ncbi:hypothetical protein FLL45_12045 [Aliikangiella marina]|uniref:Uncharacterized protein n=1 Tax=Aliikangiella marina TaxID=1712262 RepID=A0A545T8U1_9GAMM|nr:hypothetical protein [Aliikangiella marina]TQV73598.1 hypothetical protein FLL45_12045 [Aliikangiella marina]